MEQMTQSVQELISEISGKPGALQVLISLLWALGFSALMYLAYRLANSKESYRPQFAASLVSLAIVTAVLMNLIRSNLALSLGMLGSLSIVRFRTNIKDPRDIGFVFWSMAIGLAAATGSYVIGALGSLALGGFLVMSSRGQSRCREMMLVVRGSRCDLGRIGRIVEENSQKSEVQAKNVQSDSFEVVYNVHLAESQNDPLILSLFDLAGIDSVNLLAENSAA